MTTYEPREEMSLEGMALQGNWLYAIWGAGLKIFDVSSDNLDYKGFYSLPGSKQIVVNGNYVYVLCDDH